MPDLPNALDALRQLVAALDDGGLTIAKGAARPVVMQARGVLMREDMMRTMQEGMQATLERMSSFMPSNITALPAPAPPPPGPDPATRDLLLQALNMSERYGGMSPDELAWREEAKRLTGFEEPGPRAVP